MNVAILVALTGAAAALFTPLVTLLIAHRRMSGSVASSDAAAIWEASTTFRADLLERIKQLNARQVELEARITALEDEKRELIIENLRLQVELEARITALEDEKRELIIENLRLRSIYGGSDA